MCDDRWVLFTRILVPVDFSEPSIEALRLAVTIGMKEGARLTLLHVDSGPLPDGDSAAVMHRLVAGSMAAVTATSITHPLDVIRLRLSVQPELTGMVSAARSIWVPAPS